MQPSYSDRLESEKDVLYDLLDKEIAVVLSDFNAKVGSESGLKRTVGKFSLHRENTW